MKRLSWFFLILCSCDLGGHLSELPGRRGNLQEDKRLTFYQSRGALEEARKKLPNSNQLELKSIEFDSLHLFLHVSYAGGCKNHKFSLVTNGILSIEEKGWVQSPYKFEFVLLHDSRSDHCEAYINDILAFNISSLPQVERDSLWFCVTTIGKEKSLCIESNQNDCQATGKYGNLMSSMAGVWMLQSVENFFTSDSKPKKTFFKNSKELVHRIYNCNGNYRILKGDSLIENGNYGFQQIKETDHDAGNIYLYHRANGSRQSVRFSLDGSVLVFNEAYIDGPITTFKKIK